MSSYSTACVRKAHAWFFGWGFQISRGERLCLVSIGPSLYLQIEAPVKHKHYRPAGKKKEGNAASYEAFEIDEAIAMESQTIEQMVEDNCADYLSPLNVSLFLSPLPSYLRITDDKTLKKFDGLHQRDQS